MLVCTLFRNKTCIYSNEDLGFEEQDEGGALSNAGFPMYVFWEIYMSFKWSCSRTKQVFEGSLDRQDLLQREGRNIPAAIVRGVSVEVSRIPLQVGVTYEDTSR